MMSDDLPARLGGVPLRPAGPPEWPVYDESLVKAVAAAMADGSWGRYHGPHGDRLQEELAGYHNVRHVHLCASGTSAVELALRGLGVSPGDEVILAAYDFEANFKDILALGATPVLVDVRRDDVQLDMSLVEAAASDRVKAVLASHLHGATVDMRKLRVIADRHGWGVVEDACQMPGANVQGRIAGTWGDAGVLSFGGSKLLTAGRGGCVLTDRDDVLQRVRLHVQRGNDLSPLSELQAVVLRPQLKKLSEQNAIRASNVSRLRSLLRATEGLTLLSRPAGDETRPGYYKVAFAYDPCAFEGLSRDRFAEAVRAEGVALWPGFRALHRLHARRRFRWSGDLANAAFFDEHLLVLHHPVLLEPVEAIEEIVRALHKVQRYAAAIRDADAPIA